MAKANNELKDLLTFLDSSPTSWHAVEQITQKLKQSGFEPLEEGSPWKLVSGGRYYVTRNGSSLAAFIIPTQKPVAAKIGGSHTDSPGFKLKPNAEYLKEHMVMLGLEVYGAPLLSSWLNRDLGIAGRILVKDSKGKIQEKLVNLTQQPVIIPQLAIHLDRGVNDTGLILNKQEHLAALAAIDNIPPKNYLEFLLKKQLHFHTLLAHDLFLYPLEPARLIGFNQQLISSYRLDSLGSVYAILQGLTSGAKPDKNWIKMAIFWDHEEIGSETAQGAASSFAPHILERIALATGMGREEYLCLLNRSLCLSVDLTHALHPNYPEKHEPHHQVMLNKGIVIKSNAQNRYATDAKSAAIVIDLCEKQKIPYQKFVSRNDIPSGSTIGPIHARKTGMSTVDIGYAQLSMHSSRELVSSQDHLDMCKLLTEFYK